jgi:ESCRT-I complex subunit VPS28
MRRAVVMQTTQAFITAMNALELNQRAVDDIQPLIADSVSSLQRVYGIRGSDFEWVRKLDGWLKTLKDMSAHDALDEDQARQLLFDLNNSYSEFNNFLNASS